MIVSEKRLAANRANGALSRGPKTPEGKAWSSQNAFKHGILAKCLLLSHEDPDALREVYDSYMARFQPIDAVELAIVEEMISAYWRSRRAGAVEMRTLDTEMESHSAPTELDSLVATFADPAAHPKLNLLLRYQTRFNLIHSRCLRDLALLRKQLPPVLSPVAQPSGLPCPDSSGHSPALPNEPTNPPVSNKATPAPSAEPIACLPNSASPRLHVDCPPEPPLDSGSVILRTPSS